MVGNNASFHPGRHAANACFWGTNTAYIKVLQVTAVSFQALGVAQVVKFLHPLLSPILSLILSGVWGR